MISSKKVIAGVVIAMSFATTVFAAGDSCSFTFQGKKGYGNLNVNWKVTQDDYAQADTSHPSTNYYTTTYLESVKNGSVAKTRFDYGTGYSSVSMYQDTTRFNSSHGMAATNNVYDALVYNTCTDW